MAISQNKETQTELNDTALAWGVECSYPDLSGASGSSSSLIFLSCKQAKMNSKDFFCRNFTIWERTADLDFVLNDALLPLISYISRFKSRCSFTDFKWADCYSLALARAAGYLYLWGLVRLSCTIMWNAMSYCKLHSCPVGSRGKCGLLVFFYLTLPVNIPASPPLGWYSSS